MTRCEVCGAVASWGVEELDTFGQRWGDVRQACSGCLGAMVERLAAESFSHSPQFIVAP